LQNISNAMRELEEKGLIKCLTPEKHTWKKFIMTEKGTEVKTISGKILVSSSASGTRTLASGESIFVSPDNNYKVYKTQGVGGTTPEEEDSRRRRRAGALLFAGTAAGEGLVLYGINYIFTHNDHNGPKSPSTP